MTQDSIDKCQACGKVFSIAYKCVKIGNYRLCPSCANKIQNFNNIDDGFASIFNDNFIKGQDVICDKIDSLNYVYHLKIRGNHFVIPQYCSCCLAPTKRLEKIECSKEIFGGREIISCYFPLCDNCYEHRKGFLRSAKNPGVPHTSSNSSIIMIPIIDGYDFSFVFTNYEYAVLFKKANPLITSALEISEKKDFYRYFK